MRNRFDRQLLELNNELIQMGSLIEQADQHKKNPRLVAQPFKRKSPCLHCKVPTWGFLHSRDVFRWKVWYTLLNKYRQGDVYAY